MVLVEAVNVDEFVRRNNKYVYDSVKDELYRGYVLTTLDRYCKCQWGWELENDNCYLHLGHQMIFDKWRRTCQNDYRHIINKILLESRSVGNMLLVDDGGTKYLISIISTINTRSILENSEELCMVYNVNGVNSKIHYQEYLDDSYGISYNLLLDGN